MNRLLFFIVILCGAAITSAQYRFDHWTTDDGLPQNSVYAIQQTPDGYLWFTTLDGLVRFDGVKFTVFNKANSPNLPTNRFIRLLADDKDGTLFIGTEEVGLVRGQNGEFRTFTVADGLPASGIHEIQKDADGSLLITGHGGLARLRNGALTIERAQDFRDYKIYVAPSGARWELDAGGLRKIKDGQTTDYDLPFVVRRDDFHFGVVTMFEDRDEALWLPAEGDIYKLKDGAVTVFSRIHAAPTNAIRSIVQDRAGNLWFGTEKDGACRLAENRFECYNADDGLSSNFIYNIFQDREGTLWFGTNEGGINRLTSQVVSPLSVKNGLLDKNVYPLLETRAGDVWIGTYSALSHYENGVITNYTKREGLLYEVVQSLFQEEAGRLWIGSVGGVQYLENGKFTDFTRGLNFKVGETDFWDIHRDRRGALWFATRHGLIKYENGAARRLTTADGLPHNAVKIIYETRGGELWIGTDNGLAKISESAVIAQNGFGGKSVRAITEDADGTLWIGTYDGGLLRLKNNRLTVYTTADGLFSNGVFAVIEDGRGNFWMSSNQGIYRVAKQQLDDFADGKIHWVTSTAYGKSDGMLNAECNGGRQPAGFRATDGRIWIPTQDGVAIINPDSVPFNPNPPSVVIESIKIDNALSEPLAVAGGLTDKVESSANPSNNLQPPATASGSDVIISPNQNNLEIAYTGLSFIKPEQIRFRYRLENLDSEWTEAGTRRTAYFSYLPPGEYTFRVIAANSDNVWNERGAAIKIVVLPPFYRTWWFGALTVFGLAAIGFALYKWRVSALESRRRAQEEFSRRLINAHEAERSRVAAELHDSIGQTLAMIKNRAAFGLQADDVTSKEQLEAIRAQTTQAIGEVREISYNLRPYLLENLGLTKAIKSLVNKVEEVHLLKIDRRIDDIDDSFSGEAEMSVYRIIQESLNNVAKHSEADGARLTIEKTGGLVIIKIEDDGRGFDARAAPKTDAGKGGFGLLGIAERVRMLNGSLDIQTGNGKGTKLTIKIRVYN